MNSYKQNEISVEGSLSKEQLYFSYIMGELIFSTTLDEYMDYFGEDNIEELITLYKEPLSKKNIKTNNDLMKVIRIDFEKMIFALLEIKNKTSLQLISDFFKDDKTHVLEILDEEEGKGLYHLGFEVNQPMDLILYSFNYWINKFNQYFSNAVNEIKVVKLFRFPASKAFQNRVNAYVEIMRIWINLDQREEMLELFDIHHPVAISMVEKKRSKTDRSSTSYYTSDEHLIDYNGAINRLLKGDKIWHYAIYVNTPDKVEKLHACFKRLIEENSRYELTFQSLVNNKHDNSLYTKIINKERRIELEFVTELSPSTVRNCTDEICSKAIN